MGKNLNAGQYFGAVERRVTLESGTSRPAAFVLSEVIHSRLWQVPPHGHVRPYFSFLVGGSYRERAAGFSLEYKPFTMVYHPAYFEHADEIGEGGARFFMLEVPPSHEEFDRKLPTAGAERQGGRSVWLAAALYREFLRPDASEMALQTCIVELEAQVTRLPKLGDHVTPHWLARVTDRIHDQFREKLRLDDLAREVGVHPVHLSRTFSRRRGVGLHDYIEGVRMRWVCSEIGKTDADLATLAAEAGYADQSHMTRVFRRVTGMTPGEMRGALRRSPALAAHLVPGLQEAR